MHTKHLITGHFLFNFSYGSDGQLSGLTNRDSHGMQVRRDAHGVPLWLALPGGQVYWLSLSNSGTLRKVSAQGHDIAHITYHGNTGLLATKSDENSWTTVYEYVSFSLLFVPFIFISLFIFFFPFFLFFPFPFPLLSFISSTLCCLNMNVMYRCDCLNVHMFEYETELMLTLWNMSAIWWSAITVQSSRDFFLPISSLLKWLISWRPSLQHFEHTHVWYHTDSTHTNTSVWIIHHCRPSLCLKFHSWIITHINHSWHLLCADVCGWQGKWSDSEYAKCVFVRLCERTTVFHLSKRDSYLCMCVCFACTSSPLCLFSQGTTARVAWPTSPSPPARWAASMATLNAGLGWRSRRPTGRTLSPVPTCLPATPSTHSDKVRDCVFVFLIGRL